MNDRAVVSVPGKLILMGEHAAVYGCPALVAATGPRARVEVSVGRQDVVIDLPDFGLETETTWATIVSRTARAREAWRRYCEDASPERFAAVGSPEPTHLVTIALGEAVRGRSVDELPALEVRVSSRLPVGSGFGSSAATAVAVIGAVLGLLEGAIDVERIDAPAMEVERRQHGLPSGVDHKTILHGGVVWAERSEVRGLDVAPISARAPMLSRLRVFHTGRPKETTGEVVAAVKRRREQAPARFEALLGRMRRDVMRLRDHLVRADGSSSEANELIRDYERCLEELGVVPEAVRERIRDVERLGGAAKISGAGALTGDSAGCLLVHWPVDGPAGRAADAVLEFEPQEVELGADGLRLEILE